MKYNGKYYKKKYSNKINYAYIIIKKEMLNY